MDWTLPIGSQGVSNRLVISQAVLVRRRVASRELQLETVRQGGCGRYDARRAASPGTAGGGLGYAARPCLSFYMSCRQNRSCWIESKGVEACWDAAAGNDF